MVHRGDIENPDEVLSAREQFLMIGGFTLVILVHILNLFIPVMDIDSAQYADISMEMYQTGEWLQVHCRGADYLDKPPLLFWLSATAFAVLGISTFAFKLPTLLFVLLGAWSALRFAQFWYGRSAGWLAGLIFLSMQAVFLSTNDVRTDLMLTGAIMFAVWQLTIYLHRGGWRYFLGGFIGVGLAMLTKGPIGIVVPAVVLGVDVLTRRKWQWIIRPEWLLGLGIVGLMLAPMLWGLYQQYDLRPEAVSTYGDTGVSGIEFYFWTQSFGRITGESAWRDEVQDPTFFVHTFIWLILPWTLLFGGAVVWKIRELWSGRFKASEGQEFMSLGGVVLIIFMMSFSKYRLPHYIYPALPLAAVLISGFLTRRLSQPHDRRWRITQTILSGILIVGIGALLNWSFSPGWGWNLWLILGLSVTLILSFWRGLDEKIRAVILTLFAIGGINLFLSGYFYPSLIENYQPSVQVGKRLESGDIDPEGFGVYISAEYSMDFYARKIIEDYGEISALKSLPEGSLVGVLGKYFRKDIQNADLKYEVVETYPDYHITNLTGAFLNPASRATVVDSFLILRMTKQDRSMDSVQNNENQDF